MHYSIRLLGSAWLVGLSACAPSRAVAPSASVAPPAFRYPDLLRQAGVSGPVSFRVRLDSMGRPELPSLQIVATPNPGFPPAVRSALRAWRDSTMAGRLIEHTVLFVSMDTAATDSIARCRSTQSVWAVCARRMPPTIRY